MEEKYFNRVMSSFIVLVLIVLAFFILKPVLLSIIIGLIIAFVFNPVYKFVLKKIKSKSFSSLIICMLLIIIIVIPFWFITPIMVTQSLQVYFAIQKVDFVAPLQNFFPSFFSSEQFAKEVGSYLFAFVNKSANSLTNGLANLVLQLPQLALQFIVVLFTLFFALRDQDNLINYLRTLLPFSQEVEKKLFAYSKDITYSVLYGQVIIGIVQGLLVGASFFIFGVDNALLLTIFAVIAGIFPIIGPTVIWIPVAIYLVTKGSIFPAFGIILFGVLSTLVDNFLRPLIVAQRTRLHPAIILISMIGGFFFFGLLGFILGPLVLAYLIIIIEVYRNKKTGPMFLIEEGSKLIEKN